MNIFMVCKSGDFVFVRTHMLQYHTEYIKKIHVYTQKKIKKDGRYNSS